MSDAADVSLPPKRRRRGLRIAAWIAAVLVVLIVAVYFVATSSAFLKGVILPRVSHAINASVTVSDASIHPFSQIVLHDLKVQPDGQEPLITAPEIRVSYHLWDIVRGNFHVDEVALVSPEIHLVENPDGSSNLDPIMKALQAKPPAKEASAKKSPPSSRASKPPQVDVAKLALSNASILKIKNYPGGRRDLAELTNINVMLTNLKNGGTAELELGAGIQIEDNPPAGSNGLLTASLKGKLDCSFGPDLKPGSVNGSVIFSVSQAGGALGDFNAFSAALNCEVTPADIKQLALRFRKGGASLGELAVTGPFDAEKMEGRLDVELQGIDRGLLNLAGEKSGIDFGTTTIDATSEIQLAKSGAEITATGKFRAAKVRLTRAGQATPTLDFSADYEVAVDCAAQVATLRSLNLDGKQNGVPLLSGQLTRPMSMVWGNGADNSGDAAFDLTVAGLNLEDWKLFLGGLATAGKAGLKLNVSSHQDGRQMTFDFNSDVSNLTARPGGDQIGGAEVNLSAQGQAAQFKEVTLSACKLEVLLQNQPVLTASGSGTCDLATGGADLQVKLQAALARLFQALPQSGMTVSSGDVELDAHVIQKQNVQTVTGGLVLDNLTGQAGKNEFHGYSGRFNLDAVNSAEQIQINKVAGSFSQDGNSGGNFEISGTCQPALKSAGLNVKLSGLNENALRPFLEPLLAGRKLASVAVSGTVSAQYNPEGGSAVKADVQVSKLIVNRPGQQSPPPLSAGLQLDASLDKQTADVRQFQIALTPTARATNQLQFSGHVDFSKTNAIQGTVKLAADSLDLTGYYDLFAGGTNAVVKTAAATAPPSAGATPSAGANQEPAAIHLPLQNFTMAADIGSLYLHEVAVTSFQTTLTIDGGHIVLKPFQLVLNGAPVTATADLDLGVPGFKYDVAFDAEAIPVAPLVNTFQPARAGQMGGLLTAGAQVSGAGVTGASLQTNLTGRFDVDLTNLNLSVINVHSHILKSVINVIATIPQLLNSPGSGFTSLFSGKGGLMDELEQSPVEIITAHGTAGQGRIDLQKAVVQSSAFEADAVGAITLNSILTNSTINIPVTVLLSQAIAKQLNLAPATASSATDYVPLPKFLTMTGTLGDPKPDVNKMALAGTAARAIGGKLLKPGNTTSTVGNLLNQFLKLKK